MTDQPSPRPRLRRSIPRGNSTGPINVHWEARVRLTAILLSVGLLVFTAWLVWSHANAGP